MRIQNYIKYIRNEVLFYFKEQGITLNEEYVNVYITTRNTEPLLNIDIKTNENLLKFIKTHNTLGLGKDFLPYKLDKLNIPYVHRRDVLHKYNLNDDNFNLLRIEYDFDYKKHFILKDKDYLHILDYDIMDIYPFIELFYNNKKELIENITIEPNSNCIYIKFNEYVKKEWFKNFNAIALITFENEKVKIQFDYSIRFDTKHNFVFMYPNQDSITINYY